MTVSNLPRDIDVTINLSLSQIEIATDMTLMCFLTPTPGTSWQPSTRLRLYSTQAALVADSPGADAVAAGATFFAQQGHPQYFAVGKIFTVTQQASSGPPVIEAYTYVDFAHEIAATQAAAAALGKRIYCWATNYRDAANQTEQLALAAYAEANKGYASLCGNAVAAYGAGTTDLGYAANAGGYTATSVFWHDQAGEYPDVAYAAIMLGVDYSQPDSAITMKFKNLIGITTANLTQTQLTALQAKSYNVFTAIGNNARTVRDGVQAAATWYTDTRAGLDNFIEELQTAVYNVFLQRPKVPYTTDGQMMLVSAAESIARRYTNAGVFADRQVEDATEQAGFRIEPAVSIVPAAIYTASSSDRAARIAPPITITAYLAGAIHKVTVAVNVAQ